MEGTSRYPAVFLDRDGTINEEVGYLDRLDKLKLLPNVPEAVRLINEMGFKAIVVTNQSGVARGLYEESLVDEVHRQIGDALKETGAVIDGFYYCPHHPEEGRLPYRKVCSCRKPEAGMLFQAAREFNVDLGKSYMIGDTARDMEAAAAAGVKGILVKTGYGLDNLDGPVAPVYLADDILAAVRWIRNGPG
ncbi:MAG: D-glycero-beta-D-manno-heptose 1,7-bisphosphate 7-phosphatase [Smithellaceae bacterium]|nr:D-glycero-beta-D-manno-heptose 1,7-bisphosphate 7-phosphatase [Smithellaceae bacterium]